MILSPFEIEFAEDTAVQPDLLLVPPERAHRLKEERLYGAPSLAIEIISYSSKRTDRLQKRDLYMREGVDEYWIADPGLRRVERCRRSAAEPELLTNQLVWQPRLGIAPLAIDLGPLFEHLWRGLK